MEGRLRNREQVTFTSFVSPLKGGKYLAPRFDDIAVDVIKLRDYCLNERHPRGRHKARVFRSRLGLTATDAEWLRQALIEAVRDRHDELHETNADEFGRRFVLGIRVTTPSAMRLFDPRGLFQPDRTC